MDDPKTDNLQISRLTRCRRGAHAFAWTLSHGGYSKQDTSCPPGVRCDCGLYTYDEWETVIQAEKESE